MILGTIPYMSPEQAEGHVAGNRPATSTAWGRRSTTSSPAGRRSPRATSRRCSAARQGEFTPPRQVNQGVPAALEAICQKAMSRSPDDRYASPRALADEIEHWLADEPVSAWKEPWVVRARRWVTRHRTPVAAAAAGLAVAAVALGHLLHDYHLRIVERRAQADGLVVALRAAEVREVGGIVSQLRPLRSLVLENAQVHGRAGFAGTGQPTSKRRLGPAP